MKTKIILSILILSVFLSGCIGENIDISTDVVQPVTSPIEKFQLSNIELLKIEFTEDLVIKQYTRMEDVNVLEGVITTYNGQVCPETECDIRISGNVNTSIVGENYIKYTVVYNSDIVIVKNRKIIIESQNNNITFYWEFGCIKYCGFEGRPGESDGRFDIINTGNVNISKMKLIIEFYRYSGTKYNERTSIISGFFDRNMEFIENIPVNSDGYIFIKVPSQYSNEETWSYAELYFVKNNKRYHISTWKEKDNIMPPINGTMQMEQ